MIPGIPAFRECFFSLKFSNPSDDVTRNYIIISAVAGDLLISAVAGDLLIETRCVYI